MNAKIQSVVTEKSEMRYFRFGSGSRNMVILPGLSLISVMTSAESIISSYDMFSEKYTVYVFDRITNMPDVYTVPDMAHDTEAALDALGLSEIYLFGTSQGGMISQIIAAERPDLVSRMVIGSTTSKITESADIRLRKWVELAESGNIEELVMSFCDMIYSDDFLKKYRSGLKALAKVATDEDVRRFTIQTKGTKDLDITGMLDRIKCPTLVIGAEHDRIFGAEPSRAIAQKLGCELYIYDEYGHAVYDEAPDYKKRIFEFYEE